MCKITRTKANKKICRNLTIYFMLYGKVIRTRTDVVPN